MTAQTTNLILRNDTVLGVCEAIGQDFGFNPNWLRVALCLPIFWNPALVVGVYLALGLVVAATRFAYPDRTVEIVEGSKPAATRSNAGETVEERALVEERELVAA